jgi:hypothetical protein
VVLVTPQIDSLRFPNLWDTDIRAAKELKVKRDWNNQRPARVSMTRPHATFVTTATGPGEEMKDDEGDVRELDLDRLQTPFTE